MHTLGSLCFLDLDGLNILEQLKVEEALLRCGSGNYFILNSNSPASVVLGLSNNVEDLVDLSIAQSLNLPIYRRFSGGGAVVVDCDTIFTTFIFDAALTPFKSTPEGWMAFGASVFSKAFLPHELQVFGQDYALYGWKIGGNAQSFAKGRVLHHTSFLYSWNLELMQVLKMPKKQPVYRQGRDHNHFCGRLETHFLDKNVCRQRLKSAVQDLFKCENIALDDLASILKKDHRKSVEIVCPFQPPGVLLGGKSRADT